MRGKSICLAAVCGGVLLISATLMAQTRGRAVKPQKNPTSPVMKPGIRPAVVPPVARALVDPDDLAFSVTVDWSLTLTPAQLTLYQNMATAVSGYTTVPQDRLNYYAGINGYTLIAWLGLVTDVTPITGGNRVTVRVVPDLTTTEESPVTVDSSYWEQYDVIGGVVSYVGFQNPSGDGGMDIGIVED